MHLEKDLEICSLHKLEDVVEVKVPILLHCVLEQIHPDPVDYDGDSGLRDPRDSLWHYLIINPVEDIPAVSELVLYEAITLDLLYRSFLHSADTLISAKVDPLCCIHLMHSSSCMRRDSPG